MWLCGCVCTCMQCVCVACGGECVGGLWGVWMGHGGVVADSPHPHHGHLWCVLVEVVGGSCGKCCEGVGACVSGAAACAEVRRCSASLPACCGALQPRIRAAPGPASPQNAAPTDPTVSGGICLRWGSLPHPFLWGVHAVPASGGAPIFALCSFSGAWCDQAAPTGNQTGRRGRIFCCVGMGGMGEGGRLRKVGSGGHGRG